MYSVDFSVWLEAIPKIPTEVLLDLYVEFSFIAHSEMLGENMCKRYACVARETRTELLKRLKEDIK